MLLEVNKDQVFKVPSENNLIPEGLGVSMNSVVTVSKVIELFILNLHGDEGILRLNT